MKLVITTDRDFWKADIGSRKRIAQLCSYLVGTGLEVHLFLTFGGASYSADSVEAIRQQFGFASIRLFTPETPESLFLSLKKRLTERIQGAFRPASDSGSQERSLSDFRDDRVKRQFDRYVEELTPDFVLIEYIRLAYLADSLPSHIKTIIDSHDVMHLRYEAFKREGKPHWLRISKEEEIEALNKFDAVLAIQPREKEFFKEVLDKDTAVLQAGMDTIVEPLPVAGKNADLTIGFIGAHGDPNIEGITTFIEKVWPQLIPMDDKRLKLVIAGSICNILSQRDLDPGIELLGIVDDVKDFYRKSSIIINPVTFGGGLKIKTVEALAFGKPLVSTPVGAVGLEDGIGKAFLLAGNNEEFLECLNQLIESADHRQDLARGAISYAEQHFSAATVYRELADFLGLSPETGKTV